MRILVTGATGLIGKNFVRSALTQGHEVHALVRSPQKFSMLNRKQVFPWSHNEIPPTEAFSGVDAIVHLAGENVAEGSWSQERKRLIVESRLTGTRNLVAALARLAPEERPKIFVSGSAIGIYGYSSSALIDENSGHGDDFLAKLCTSWESEALKAEALGMRVVLARTGIVLSKEGGALSKMPPIQIANGKNWMSWIHIEDMVRAIFYALRNEAIQGAVNCVAPNPVHNKEFTKALAKAKGIPSFGFVPRIFLDIALGEVANVLVSSLRVEPKALNSAGFQFAFPTVQSALEKEFSKGHPLDSYLFKDQFVPLSAAEVFPFFCRAENLEALTPPWLNFKIVSKSSADIHAGTLIDYKLKIHGFPTRWRTLIKEWKENERFVDEQLRGPYAKWHHIHTFENVPGGCLLRDEITYRVPGSLFGNLLLKKWITNDVNKIFAYRQLRILELLQSGNLK